MAIRLLSAPPGAAEADVRALEVLLGARLPEEYRRFLLANNGAEPEDNEFSIPDDDNSSGVNEFLSVDQIREEVQRFGNRFPRDMIPIAFAEGGNLVFLARDGRAVMFWDHEYELGPRDPFIKIAPSFDAFWESLEKFDPESVQLNPDDIESVWVDPDLLK